MTKVIAQMIVKNESDRYLKEVLEHASTVVDEIVITDDGSTDDTVAIAKEFTDNVYVNDESLFAKNEGELRQKAWYNLENHAIPGDVILCMDADEKLFVTSIDFEKLFRSRFEVFGITFFHMWNKTHYRIDKAWKPVLSSRMFRFKPGGKFKDRRLACGSEPTYVAELIQARKFLPSTGLYMQHLGYMRDEDKQAKYDRYMELDRGEFHARAHLESILDKNPELVPWEDLFKRPATVSGAEVRKGRYGTIYFDRR